MTARIDGGRINFCARFPIEPDETGASLTAKCVRHGVPLFFELLDVLTRDEAALPRIEQHLGQRRYYGPEVPEEGVVDWTNAAEFTGGLHADDDMKANPVRRTAIERSAHSPWR